MLATLLTTLLLLAGLLFTLAAPPVCETGAIFPARLSNANSIKNPLTSFRLITPAVPRCRSPYALLSL